MMFESIAKWNRNAEPAAPHEPGALTGIVARDGTKVLVSVNIDLADVQRRAEAQARGDDPVRRMTEIVEDELRRSGAQGTSAGLAKLRSTFSRFVMSGDVPPSIEVPAKKAAQAIKEAAAANGGAVEDARDAVQGSADTLRDFAAFPPELFEKVVRFPDQASKARYERLIGLEKTKERLHREAIVLTQPDVLGRWARTHHGAAKLGVIDAIAFGTPLVIFAGDVGTGKSELAETFGAAVADSLEKPTVLLRMSIAARGKGFVGDMTQQIVKAIDAVEREAKQTGNVTILLVDEADAMAESRETREMHHEDRAGVNALIQGIDRLRAARLPVLVVFCTNRLSSLDPAVQRRAVDVFAFRRPDEEQRRAHLESLLAGVSLTSEEIDELVNLTGPRSGRDYGFTYSDLADRFARSAVIRAFPDEPLSFALLRDVVMGMDPTRPFAVDP